MADIYTGLRQRNILLRLAIPACSIVATIMVLNEGWGDNEATRSRRDRQKQTQTVRLLLGLSSSFGVLMNLVDLLAWNEWIVCCL